MTTRSILLTILNILSTFVGLVIGAHILIGILGVNDSVPIVQWINSVSASLTSPFQGLLSNIVLSEGSFIDLNAVIALIVYSLIFSLIYRLIARVSEPTVVEERTVAV